jgi:type I restriction-modification system DNA methylase subunit
MSEFTDLKSTLWDAANTLRGSAVDRTDWKGYILPLLFFKRISDCWDEETAEAAELYGDADPSHFEEIPRGQATLLRALPGRASRLTATVVTVLTTQVERHHDDIA